MRFFIFRIICVTDLSPSCWFNLLLFIYWRVQEKTEEEEFSTGPLSVLTMSVKNNTQVCDLCTYEDFCCFNRITIDCVFCNAFFGKKDFLFRVTLLMAGYWFLLRVLILAVQRAQLRNLQS